MQDMTVTIQTSFVGGALVAAHFVKPMIQNGYGRLAGRFMLLIYVAGTLGFFAFTLMGGTVKLDLPPLVAGLLKLLGLSVSLAGAWLGYQDIVSRDAPSDLTPPSHPSRTPPAP